MKEGEISTKEQKTAVKNEKKLLFVVINFRCSFFIACFMEVEKEWEGERDWWARGYWHGMWRRNWLRLKYLGLVNKKWLHFLIASAVMTVACQKIFTSSWSLVRLILTLTFFKAEVLVIREKKNYIETWTKLHIQ